MVQIEIGSWAKNISVCNIPSLQERLGYAITLANDSRKGVQNTSVFNSMQYSSISWMPFTNATYFLKESDTRLTDMTRIWLFPITY